MKHLLALFFLLLGAIAAPAQENKPSILFCSPQGVGAGWVDLAYVQELHAKGFEVDYTTSFKDFTWDRFKQYNVIVLFVTPDAFGVAHQGLGNDPSGERIKKFVETVEQFLAAGGGVFCIPWEMNTRKQMLIDLTRNWGVQLPVETIVESDAAKLSALANASYPVPLALTDQVQPSPVSDGVKQIWYPVQPAYNAAHTGPLHVDDSWQVVVKASKTAKTKPIDLTKTGFAMIEKPFQRAEGVAEPPLFAIRPYKAGRIAIVNQWPQFTFGSGLKWVFDRQVLSKGANGTPSDVGRLLENTFRWLAQPSLQSKGVGGYVTKADTLVAPNRREAARKLFEYNFWYWEDEVAQWHRPPKFAPMFRGIIGAKSAYSSGKGTVKEYADAAKKAGLHFVVFIEDFDKLTAEKYEQLKADCKAHSDDEVQLIAGFTIDSNIGDHMFFFGPDGKWPPPGVLTGPNKTLYYLQPQDETGKFTGFNGDSFNWMFEYHGQHGNVGYYNFLSNPKSQRIPTLRCYGAAALRYYKDGKLVEDVTDDYITSAQSTIPPAPMSFNEVRSPEELIREANSGNALTYAQARSVRTIFQDALWWPNQYQSNNCFPSDGPVIHDWPHTVRVMTLGSEEFVTMPNIMVSRLEVTAERGLKEIAIYNGRELFRRFLPGGAKEFYKALLLDATIHRNLVVVATDMKGGKAVSFARRCWKEGGRQPVFCSDHVNDCKTGGWLLAHGPTPMLAHFVVPLPDDVAGFTWDGGPPASIPLASFQESRPAIETDKGNEEGHRFNQTPLLDFTDEGAVAVANFQGEVFDESVLRVVNPWHTFGPIGGPSKLIEFTLRYREYHNSTIGTPEAGWAGPGIREGINASLFRSEVRFKENVTVQKLTLLHNNLKPAVAPVQVIIGRAPHTIEQVIDYSGGTKSETVRLAPGDWFAVVSPKIASGHLFVVREQPVQLLVAPPSILTISADFAGTPVKKGETHQFELFSMGIPLNVPIRDKDAMQRLLAYVNEPAGMKIVRGKRVASPGFVECAPDNGAVEVSVPRHAEKLNVTLPLRVNGLNRRWSAGLFQKQGYVKGDYGTGANRYRPLGVDQFGFAFVPMYVGLADLTHMVAGHPVIADERGKDLFIQVTHLYEEPHQWHVSVNNPTDKPVKTKLRKAMDLPGFIFHEVEVTVQPGEYRVIM